jgi:hypothetical protein
VGDAVVRLRQLRGPARDRDVAARLERIEAAVDAIAIEVERLGERQRYNSRLGHAEAATEPGRLARPTTPE